MNDGGNLGHRAARVRTAVPGARFQWLNSQLSSSCKMQTRRHERQWAPNNDKARTGRGRYGHAGLGVVSSLPSRVRLRRSKMSALSAAVRQTPVRKECPCSLPPCTRHKRVTIVRADRRYRARSLRASRLRSGHRGQWVLLASPTTSCGDKFGARPYR